MIDHTAWSAYNDVWTLRQLNRLRHHVHTSNEHRTLRSTETTTKSHWGRFASNVMDSSYMDDGSIDRYVLRAQG